MSVIRLMGRFIFKRILQLIPLLLLVSFASFWLLHMAGSDAVLQKMENTGGLLNKELIAAYRAELGLDQDIFSQYFTWLKHFFSGNMGFSYVSGAAVGNLFFSKLPASFLLAGLAMLLTLVISLPLAACSALYKNKPLDYIIRFLTYLTNSMPGFLIALLLLYIFAVKLRLFPVIATADKAGTLFLPALALALAMSAKYIRQIRAVILDECEQAYVVGAQARGLPFSRIFFFSIFRNILLTVLTLAGLSFGSLLGGTAIIESIFLLDGVGKMAIDAVLMRDYPVIQVYVLWMTIIFVAVNTALECSARFLDPRLGAADEKELT